MLHDPSVNCHLAFADIKSHGYYIATVNKHRFLCNYYFVDNILTRTSRERLACSFSVDAETFMLS